MAIDSVLYNRNIRGIAEACLCCVVVALYIYSNIDLFIDTFRNTSEPLIISLNI